MSEPRPPSAEPAASSQGIVLFDGVCNLCNGFVNFLLDHDAEGYFRFGALQSPEAQALLAPYGIDGRDLESVVLLEGGRAYRRSEAALRILRRLGGAWSWLYAFMLVPRPLRDAIYGLIAANRYRLFGLRASCRLPTPELRNRFI